MSEKSVAQKLLIKEGRTVLFVNPPENYSGLLGQVPPNVNILNGRGEPADLIQVFVEDRRELEAQLGSLKELLKPEGLLWVTYHKGTSKIKTDIHRDTIAAYAKTLGLEAVAMISINEDWSALRLKVL